MSFVLRMGAPRRSPLPAYMAGGARYEYTCGWCGESFMTAAQLIAHVAREREAAA